MMFNLFLMLGLALGLALSEVRSEPQTAAQLLAQLPRNPKVTSCPASWIQPLLLPCRCNEEVPNQLFCTGRSIIDPILELMNYRLRFTLKYQQVMNMAKQKQLKASLAQFNTLVVANTSLTRLDSPVFRLFPIKNVVLDSDQLLREVHLVGAFGKQNKQQTIVQLDNLFLVNMKNVNVDE